jgi:CsoR family transcriptional regulator, copper-sensing transcriptional repressor
MMNEKQKARAITRLRKIEGQIRGLQKMVEQDRYCMDILAQTRSVFAALRGVEDMIMENHMKTCVVDAIRNDDPAQQQEKIGEVMTVLSQFRKHG